MDKASMLKYTMKRRNAFWAIVTLKQGQGVAAVRAKSISNGRPFWGTLQNCFLHRSSEFNHLIN